MNTQNQSEIKNPNPKAQPTRDEQTLGRPQSDKTENNPEGFAEDTEPTWAPPESKPEPLTSEPVMSQNQPSNPNLGVNTNSPA